MKKNIIIILLVVTNLLSFAYALIQQAEAKRMELMAVENARQAVKSANEARSAQVAAHEATAICQQQLSELKARK